MLVHGLGSAGTIWKSLIPDLINDFTVYSIDLPGHGEAGLVKDEKYDPYLLVKVPFKDNRYNIDVCDKDLSHISVTNLYRFTKVKCDIYIDKIWKYNESYICKWKVNKVLLV